MSLGAGDPAPWFTGVTDGSDGFTFQSEAGVPTVVLALGSGGPEPHRALWDHLRRVRRNLAGPDLALYAITMDPEDRARRRLLSDKMSVVYHDLDGGISRLWGVLADGPDDMAPSYAPTLFVLDEGHRVVGIGPLNGRAPEEVATLIRKAFADLPVPADARVGRVVSRAAPVMTVPYVFPKTLCETLISLWHTDNTDSGFMRSKRSGERVGVIDHRRKRRRDHFIQAGHPMWKPLCDLVTRRVVPNIARAYHYEVTRAERFVVARYSAQDHGFFRKHRDFDGPRSHRAFAMTANLNTDEYEGGELWFPEYGPDLHRPETGAALIFSGYLLHEARPVVRGDRFALLSFFYGDREAATRTAYREEFGEKHETIEIT